MSERDLARLLALVEKHLGTAWLDLAEWLRSLPENELLAIEQRVAARDFGAIVRQVDAAAKTFATETHAAYTQSGRAAAQWLDKQPALRDTLVRFDSNDDRVVRAARRNELELVQGFREERNQVTRQIVRRTIEQGTAQNPREVARQFRDSIGLTAQQETYLENYRQALRRGDYANVMGRELHDARSNRMLRGRETPLTDKQIEQMTERYRKALIAHRAENIARTEASKNVHTGLRESMEQAVDRGDVEPQQLVREWIPGPPTEDSREMHRARSLLSQRPAIGEPYVMPDGVRMMHPGDSAGGPKHTNGCRCTEAWTFRP